MSTGRTGTNYLFSKLKGCQGLLVHWEILHPQQSYVDSDVRDFILNKHSFSQDSLSGMARSNKRRLLNLLRDTRDDLGFNCMIYKVFPINGHLNMNELKKLIIRRRDVGVIMIIRNPLRVFLSIRKAQRAGSFSKIDTTSIVVELPPEELINFVQRSTQLFKSTIELCKRYGTPYALISYERIFEDLNDQAPADVLLDCLNTFMDPPLQRFKEMASELRKQDKSKLAVGIANFDEVSAELEKGQYSALLDDSTEYQAALGLQETIR